MPSQRSSMLILLVIAGNTPLLSQAQSILFEDYRGKDNTGNDVVAGREYYANHVSGDAPIVSLLQLHRSGSAPARTGSASVFNWREEDTQLCTSYWSETPAPPFATPTSQVCRDQIMGRVAYTVVRFPTEGIWTFHAAHDDNVRIDLSSDYAIGQGYRTAGWDLPVNQVPDYTGDISKYSTIGTVVAPRDNSCLLMRVVWNNYGGRNYLRVAASQTASYDPYMPASWLVSPLDAGGLATCTGGAIASPTIRLGKRLPDGRQSAEDQFTLRVVNDGTVLASGQTSGGGSGDVLTLPERSVTVTTANGMVEVEELPGAGKTLSNYSVSIACTKDTAGATGQPLAAARVSGQPARWRLNLVQGERGRCIITNAHPRSQLGLRKSSDPEGTLRVGQQVIYTLEASNAGPDPADGALLKDALPPGLECSAVTCTATGGANCPSSAQLTVAGLTGAGVAIPAFPANGALTVRLTCAVTAQALE